MGSLSTWKSWHCVQKGVWKSEPGPAWWLRLGGQTGMFIRVMNRLQAAGMTDFAILGQPSEDGQEPPGGGE